MTTYLLLFLIFSHVSHNTRKTSNCQKIIWYDGKVVLWIFSKINNIIFYCYIFSQKIVFFMYKWQYPRFFIPAYEIYTKKEEVNTSMKKIIRPQTNLIFMDVRGLMERPFRSFSQMMFFYNPNNPTIIQLMLNRTQKLELQTPNYFLHHLI